MRLLDTLPVDFTVSIIETDRDTNDCGFVFFNYDDILYKVNLRSKTKKKIQAEKCVHCGSKVLGIEVVTPIASSIRAKNFIAHSDEYPQAYLVARLQNGRHMTIDHKIPIAKGGSGLAKNLQPMCDRCNSKKGAKISPEYGNYEEYLQMGGKVKLSKKQRKKINKARHLLARKQALTDTTTTTH